ncbi:hypothetical protein F7725_012721 [Dissostichus mawsoni]|uniref:Uncharacterized protein n=1 Tax=Dissostichus mawsoni TaxID=36200 RepID=A0A7J5YQD9_DISMA|nr:hypothetical protein F7725_012721 [Dissostichus mawsoni]
MTVNECDVPSGGKWLALREHSSVIGAMSSNAVLTLAEGLSALLSPLRTLSRAEWMLQSSAGTGLMKVNNPSGP